MEPENYNKNLASIMFTYNSIRIFKFTVKQEQMEREKIEGKPEKKKKKQTKPKPTFQAKSASKSSRLIVYFKLNVIVQTYVNFIHAFSIFKIEMYECMIY